MYYTYDGISIFHIYCHVFDACLCCFHSTCVSFYICLKIASTMFVDHGCVAYRYCYRFGIVFANLALLHTWGNELDINNFLILGNAVIPSPENFTSD